MSADEITLRLADTADLERLIAVAAASPGAPQWAAHTWQQVLNSAVAGSADAAGQRAVVIAESSNELAGFGVVGCAADKAEIESLAVSPAWRHRGTGRLLCTKLLAFARAQRAREAVLEVRVSNVAARSLYSSLGFREAGIRRAYYRDPEEDALVMIMEL